MVRVRLLTFAAVIAAPVFAQNIYTWEDAEGLHYTDDASRIPKQTRVELTVAAARPVSRGISAGPTAVTVATPPAPATAEFKWRDAFIAAHRRIATVRQRMEALKATLPQRTECVPQPGNQQQVDLQGHRPYAGPNVVCQVNVLHDQMQVQIAQETVELKNAELDLEQLERRASMQAVPPEWRRGW
jgi:hypothetical protein